MARNSKIIKEIRDAITDGKIRNPFTKEEWKRACPGWADATYNVFLLKHRVCNPGGYTEYFEQLPNRLWKLIEDS